MLLACSVCISGCCYVVSRAFWEVATLLLCSWWGVLDGWQGVARVVVRESIFFAILIYVVVRKLLGCSGWFLECYYVVARVFWVVFRVLLCSC